MLKATALMGFGGGGIGPVSIEGSISGDVNTVGGTTHTMSSFDVGLSNPGKRAILLVTVSDESTGTIDDVTVGGVSLTERATAINTQAEFVRAAIWSGNISGLSGSQAIVITTSNPTESAGVSGVSVHNLKSLIPTDSGTYQNDNSATATISALSGSTDAIVIGCGVHQNDGQTATWNNLTEKADIATGGGAEDHRHTAAWDLGERASADETISWGSSANIAAAGASFR